MRACGGLNSGEPTELEVRAVVDESLRRIRRRALSAAELALIDEASPIAETPADEIQRWLAAAAARERRCAGSDDEGGECADLYGASLAAMTV